MDILASTIEIFVSSVTVAVFGGTAILVALEARGHRLALNEPKVVVRSLVSTTADEIQLATVQPAKAGNSERVAKVA